jgi:hypothetical protein
VTHFTSPDFWRLYEQLPENIRRDADKNFDILKADPHHPSLRLKKVDRYWSARIGGKFLT